MQSLHSNNSSVGAESLFRSLLSEERHLSRERFSKIVRSYTKLLSHADEDEYRAETPSDQRVLDWYRKAKRVNSYHANHFRVPPERTMLFAEFKNDPYYHLKNVVEVISRGLIEGMLKESGRQSRVVTTSDSDDIFGSVDCIAINYENNGGKSYVGYDVAVSSNEQYLDEKWLKTETVCHEFNACNHLGDLAIPREVFAIPPKIMLRYLCSFLDTVAAGEFPNFEISNELFTKAVKDAQKATIQTTSNRVNAIIN